MCNFTIEYPKPKDEMIRQLQIAIESQTDGFFQGDTTTGMFSFTAKGFELAGNYHIEGDLVELNVTKKPWLLSCKRIESEIRSYLEKAE